MKLIVVSVFHGLHRFSNVGGPEIAAANRGQGALLSYLAGWAAQPIASTTYDCDDIYDNSVIGATYQGWVGLAWQGMRK